MKIYLASSLKNWRTCRELGRKIRETGHNVYVFCDSVEPSQVATEAFQKRPEYKTLDAKDALKHPLTYKIWFEDMYKLRESDCVLLLLPCGINAHMEAAWAKGQGKQVVVFGPVVSGFWDTMYLCFDQFFVASPGTTRDETQAMYQWFRDQAPGPLRKMIEEDAAEIREHTKQ